MKIIPFLFIAIIAASCDVPQRSIAVNELSNNSQNQNGGQNPITGSGNGDGNGSGNGSGNNQPGFEYCTNTTPYNGQAIGNFGLCRHSSDERRFKVKFVNGSTSGTCFVPTHRLNNGTSYKLGIAECVYNQPNSTYYMTLNKELMPPYYNSPRTEPINSVMVLAAPAVNTYMACMGAKEAYFLSAMAGNAPCCLQIQNSPMGPKCVAPNPQCEQAANAHANAVCTQFTQAYSGQYKEVLF